MKEIIYLDTDIMNSMLAQLDEGLINSFSLEQSNQESESAEQQSSRGKNAGLNGSIIAGSDLFGGKLQLGASLGNNGNESTRETHTMLDGQKDVLNKAFHDHALEVLTSKLVENDLLCGDDKLQEGDLYLGESTYRFYDFNLIKKAMDHNIMENILHLSIEDSEISYEQAIKIVNRKNPTSRDREMMDEAQRVIDAHQQSKPVINLFQQMNMFSSFASNLLEDLTVIKTNNNIGLLKKKYLRESVEALSFRTDNRRKVKFLVRVIGKKTKVFNGYNFPDLGESDLDLIPNMMLDIILGSFKIIEKDDLIVTPIAIYYE